MDPSTLTRMIVAWLGALVLGAGGHDSHAHARMPLAGPRAGIVQVAAPTGARATDRASILAALERARPGDTIQFAPGT